MMAPPKWALLPTFAFLATLAYVYFHLSTPSVGLATPGITHIVMFQWKESAEEAAITEATHRLLSLKHRCTHPVTSAPYITSLTGGRDNSPENLAAGLTHAFVVGFRTAWERDYYVRDDPYHLSFVESIGDIVERAVVLDFEPGRF